VWAWLAPQEFLAATINVGKIERDEHLKMAFEHFDLVSASPLRFQGLYCVAHAPAFAWSQDGNGQISHSELQTALSNLGIKVRQPPASCIRPAPL
jgi:Ca2+-binding EF-hand superfamily protein